MQMILGPLLGYENQNTYSVCILTDALAHDVSLADLKLNVNINGKTQVIPFTASQEKVVSQRLYARAIINCPDKTTEQTLSYFISYQGANLVNSIQEHQWQFVVPAKNTNPRVLFASCNGFSSAKLARDTPKPDYLWRVIEGKLFDNDIHKSHAANNFPWQNQSYANAHLLIFGGDQIYADSLFEGAIPALQDLIHADEDKFFNSTVTSDLENQLEDFYEKLYIRYWANISASMTHALATIPSIMMWDDHDIFDGWGSYPKKKQDSAIFQAIFRAAEKYFRLFQLRTKENQALLLDSSKTINKPYSQFVRMGNFGFLLLDLRSQRRIDQLLSPEHWQLIKDFTQGNLAQTQSPRLKNHLQSLQQNPLHALFVVTGIPVVYRSFKNTEKFNQTIGFELELSDDMRDHWSALGHQGDQVRFVNLLYQCLDNTTHLTQRIVLLAGDVHIATAGVITRQDAQQTKIHQIISSGIVHPPPGWLAWQGLELTSKEPEDLDHGRYKMEILRPNDAPDRYLRARNFVAIEESNDKIWVTWEYETRDSGKKLPTLVIQ